MDTIRGHLILLHGHEDEPAAFEAHAVALAPLGWTASAPAGPFRGTGGASWFGAEDDGAPDPLDVAVALGELDAEIAQRADRLEGGQRLVLAGFSQGAALALLHLTRREPPSVPLDAVVVIAGWLPAVAGLDLDLDAVAGRARRVLFAHGEDDEVVPPPLGRSVHRLLERHGVDSTFVERPTGHEVAPFAAPVRAWLDAAPAPPDP